MYPASGHEDTPPLPARPRFACWALPPETRPVPDGTLWAEVTPELLRDVLEELRRL